MLTRFVRIQLAIFAIASIIGLVVMAVVYLQAPTLLGVGRLTVTVELPATGGLYRFSNVTYRGVQVGKVTEITLMPQRGAKATLSLSDSPKIPAALNAEVRSISAVGEQYLDLQPDSDAPPYLHDGSVISSADVTVPQEVGPVLDQTSALINSIPKDKLGLLLDESFQAFNGAGHDLGSLIDSTSKVTGDLHAVREQSRSLVVDSAPLLDAQAGTADDLRTWARSLAGITDQLVDDDPQLRTILKDGPGAADEASRLLTQLKPTLPVLLANMTSVGQLLVTYRPGLEQILVLFPPFVANILSAAPDHNPTGLGQGDFALTEGDPPSCTVGFLPPNQWRSPEDTSEVDTPEGLYCKLPHDSPLAVRGARNYPCMGKPGKRAPTVEICNSDRSYQPLAMREHMTGPYPLDPNLIAQGVPPDDRVNADENLYGPTEPVPAPVPPVPENPGQATPSAFTTNNARHGPTLAFAQYDPNSGRYVGSDGQTYQQADLVPSASPTTWKDLILAEHT
ncbi:MCE family protein [Mycolicibacterium sp. XJ870]